MSNNLVNQSTKAISTNELRWIGPVLAVVSSGPMDLFLHHVMLFALCEVTGMVETDGLLPTVQVCALNTFYMYSDALYSIY